MTPPTPNPIRAAREQAGLSREALAFKAGVSFKTLERLEAGARSPRRSTLKVIADVLGVEPASLLVEEAA